MDHRRLGKTDLCVTPVGFGAVKIGRSQGLKYPVSFQLPSQEQVTELLNKILDLGINYIDTAPAYGLSEQRIGHAIERRRSEFVLSTKVGERFEDGQSTYDFSSDAIQRSIEQSLRHLQTDVVDLVFIHSDGNDLAIQNETDAVSVLQCAKERGQVRAIGMSSNTVPGAQAALKWADAIMVEYHRESQSHANVIAQAAKADVGVVVKKGLDSGKLPASEAVGFVLANNNVVSLTIGSLSLEHLRQNIAAADQIVR